MEQDLMPSSPLSTQCVWGSLRDLNLQDVAFKRCLFHHRRHNSLADPFQSIKARVKRLRKNEVRRNLCRLVFLSFRSIGPSQKLAIVDNRTVLGGVRLRYPKQHLEDTTNPHTRWMEYIREDPRFSSACLDSTMDCRYRGNRKGDHHQNPGNE